MTHRLDAPGSVARRDRDERAPSSAAQLMLLIDRAHHDRSFRVALRCDPVAAAAGLGLQFSDAEWGGLRDLLAD